MVAAVAAAGRAVVVSLVAPNSGSRLFPPEPEPQTVTTPSKERVETMRNSVVGTMRRSLLAFASLTVFFAACSDDAKTANFFILRLLLVR